MGTLVTEGNTPGIKAKLHLAKKVCQDNKSCTICGGDDVYYGANGRYILRKNAPYKFQCSDDPNGIFGSDPITGTKHCYCIPPTQAELAAREAAAKAAAEKKAAAREAAEKKAASQISTSESELVKLGLDLNKLQDTEGDLNTDITKLEDQIKNLQLSSTKLQTSLNADTVELQSAQDQLKNQMSLLENKRRLLITRNRMLQLSQDRNIYKQKVIYTLLAVIIACFVIILVGYVSFKKLSQ